jgi:hypothetical protein
MMCFSITGSADADSLLILSPFADFALLPAIIDI